MGRISTLKKNIVGFSSLTLAACLLVLFYGWATGTLTTDWLRILFFISTMLLIVGILTATASRYGSTRRSAIILVVCFLAHTAVAALGLDPLTDLSSVCFGSVAVTAVVAP